MKRNVCIALFSLVLAARLATAQCTVVTTIENVSPSSFEGMMFNVANVSAGPLIIRALEVRFSDTGTAFEEIWTRAGTWQGFQSTPSAWTLVGTAAVVHAAFQYTPLPIPINVAVGPGATQAFYLTSSNGHNLRFFNGLNQLNSVIGSDANIQITCGVAKVHPFGQTVGLPNDGCIFAGRVLYTLGGVPYQVNSAQASLKFNNVVAAPCYPAVLNKCAGANMGVELASSFLGNGYEILMAPSSLVPGGSFVTANGQIVNVNLGDPNMSFLWNLAFPPFPSPLGAFTPAGLQFPMPLAPVLSTQLAILDSSHPDGFRLSQATELHGLAPSQTAAGPVGDDVAMAISAGYSYSDGVCGSFVAPALPFYGVLRNTYYIITNGRITFPGSDTAWIPVVPPQAGMVGCWTDFCTWNGGNITMSLVGTTFTATWHGIGYVYQTGPASTFSISVNAATGVIVLNGLQGIATQTGSLNMFMGASPGVGATDPGQAAFGVGGSGAAPLASSMIYRFGTAGPGLSNGATTVTLTPNGLGNYTWSSN